MSQPVLSHAQAAPKPVAAAPVQKPAEVAVEAATTAAVEATTSTASKAKVAAFKPVVMQAKVEVQQKVTASTAKPSFAPKDAKDEEDPFQPTLDASDVATENEVNPSSDEIETMDE